MNVFTGVPAVLLASAAAAVAVGISGPNSGPVWLLVVCATMLPFLAALNAFRKGRRIGGREGMAWCVLSVSMALMVPIYAFDFVGAYSLEYLLIAAAYTFGGIAIVIVPLPNAGPYQRAVASLDAVGVGVVVAVATFWAVSGSEVDIAGHTEWVISDAVIIGMVGYVAVRRSQRRGVDWPLFWVIAGVAAYLGGALISSVGSTEYHLGHEADFAYVFGMTSFALAPLVRERRNEVPQHILEPVRWGHVLAPYLLVAVLATAYVAHQVSVWGDDPMGSLLGLAILAVMLLVLVRQLALVAEQRRKVELEQAGVIATISHELRTPLTAVVGFLDLLEDWGAYSDEEKIEMVALMRNQSHVLDRVVGDLIDVARDRIEHLDLQYTRFAVAEFLADAIERVPELHVADLHVDVARGAALTADRERMMQAATNYLSNAAHYGSSRVDVVAFEALGATVIEVHDDGPGIPDIYERVIWERFERGPQRQSAIPGSGIGLSIARGIARSHEGDVHYRTSERLGGACFSMRVPLRRPFVVEPTSAETRDEAGWDAAIGA